MVHGLELLWHAFLKVSNLKCDINTIYYYSLLQLAKFKLELAGSYCLQRGSHVLVSIFMKLVTTFAAQSQASTLIYK